MSRIRIYQDCALAPATSLQLDEKASHHLARVLRTNVGEHIIVFNGQGGEYQGVITHITKKGVDVSLTAFAPIEVESPIEIELAQGIARGEKMDMIVQKGVELGVSRVVPLMTERCNVKLGGEREEKRLQHWQAVAISACEQSGRNRIPHIQSPQSLKAWLTSVQADLAFVLSPHVQATFPSQPLKAHARVVLLIGPEGGLTDFEVELAMQHGFLPLSLGPRVMRTETAALAAIASLQYRYGDFGGQSG